MLPLDLLRARRRRGTIRPLYASEDKLGLARTLISVFKAHVDGKRGELREALSRCEELGYNYKLVRGIAAVLEDRCIFQTLAYIDPTEARHAVFEETGGRVVATEQDRRRVLAAAAFRLGVSTEDLDASLYADLWDEQVLTDFDPPTPQELLKEYNFALTLALITQARRIELTYRGRDEELELVGESLGRCRVHEAGGFSKLTIERLQSSRAGQHASELEALLYRLVFRKGWRLSAEVAYRSRKGKRYLFELSEDSHGRLVTPSKPRRTRTPSAPARHKPTAPSPNEIVIVDELASHLGITEDEARRRLKRGDRRYIELGDVFITPEKLRELEEALTSAPDMRLPTVVGTLRSLGCRSPLPVLEALGYAVEWAKDRSRSKVYRLGRHRTTP